MVMSLNSKIKKKLYLLHYKRIVDLEVDVIVQLYKEEVSFITVEADGGP